MSLMVGIAVTWNARDVIVGGQDLKAPADSPWRTDGKDAASGGGVAGPEANTACSAPQVAFGAPERAEETSPSAIHIPLAHRVRPSHVTAALPLRDPALGNVPTRPPGAVPARSHVDSLAVAKEPKPDHAPLD